MDRDRTSARGSLWRTRWAAIGAAIAVTLGGGGWFVANAASSPPSTLITIDPVRILDTRDPINVGLPGPFTSPVSQKLQVTGPVPTTSGVQTAVPIGATGVLLNVTVINATRSGFLSVRPGDASGAPSTSSLNFTAGEVVPNAVQVGLPTVGANAGKIDITYDALGAAGPTTDVLIDVVGFSTQLDAYTKAQTDAAIAAAVDTTRVQTVTAGGALASFVFPAAQLQLGPTTNITTTRAGHLDLHFIGSGGLQCSNAFAANIAWIELNGTPIRSSVAQWGAVASGSSAFDQRQLRGITATPIPAGTHQLRAQLACTTGTTAGGGQLGSGSWIVSVLAGTPNVAALVAPD